MEKIFVSERLGKTIRKKRKARNITQEGLANTLSVEHSIQISSTYISELEKGYSHFNKEKLEAVCGYLNIDIEKVNELPSLDVLVDSTVEQLKIIEVEIRDEPENALEQLRQLEQIHKHIGKDDPILTVYGYYLRGRYYYLYKKMYEEAVTYFEKGIQIAECYPELRETNLLSVIYYLLSRMMNYQNKLQKSYYYSERGLETFLPTGERTYNYYLLWMNKASVLEKMKEYGQALSIVDNIWQDQSFPMFSDCRLNLYQLRVELLNKTGRYIEAIPVAQEGLEFARLDNNHDRKFEFLSSLGEANYRLGNLTIAERYYQLARKLEGKIKNKALAITTYSNLGKIYIQQRNLTEAEKVLKSAVELGEKQDEYKLCQALVILGGLYHQKGKDEKALQVLERALCLCNKLSIDHEIENILTLLAKLSLQLKVPESEKYTTQLVEFLMSKNMLGGGHMFHHDPPEN